VTLSDRDRRILLILVPIVVVIAYWFLILSPKRSDLSDAKTARDSAVAARDAAVAQANQLEQARQTFAADYAEVVRLGKAIPAQVDAPGVLLQLSSASSRTHIDFQTVNFSARAPATVATTTAAPAQPSGTTGGQGAQSQPGQQAQAAGNAVNQGNQASSNVNAASGGSTTTTTTTESAPATTTAPAGLDGVAVTFTFVGTYFDLADFFHKLKRFVYVANKRVFVRGRLLTIDTLSFSPGGTGTSTTGEGSSTNLSEITASVAGTVYLSPKATGLTGGATAAGPAGTQTETTPSGAQTSAVPLAAVAGR